MSEPVDDNEGEISRGLANLVLLTAFLVIVGIGVWLAFALDEARNADNCISQGRRNCTPIQVPVR
jgi:hypothetical protein